MSEYKVGDLVYINTSDLGKVYGLGEVKAIWADKISVDFSGHIGHYTISQHEIKKAGILPISTEMIENE